MATRSAFGDKFNHDDWASSYDKDVANESHPIRAGYEAVLSWVVERSNIRGSSHVLDLGCGTGNLSARLPGFGQLTCVDISSRMLERARQKLGEANEIAFVQADLLEYFEQAPAFDRILSTYTVHHLTEQEKVRLFSKIYNHLRPGGRAVFGDLMFEDASARDRYIDYFSRQGQREIAEDILEEFFWLLDGTTPALIDLGFEVEVQRFSDLSWGVAAVKG